MVLAYILITTKVGQLRGVVDELRKLDYIQEANMFTGPYDIIAIAEAESLDGINNILITKIRQNPEIEDTTTCIRIDDKRIDRFKF